MSHHIILAFSVAATLLTLSATAQARQDRHFTALAQQAYAPRNDPANPSAADTGRSHSEFGSFGAASVAHTFGY